MFKVNGDKVEKVYVELGISDDDYQEVNSGIEENDLVVVGPDKILRHLKDGDSVNAENKDSKKKEDAD